MIMQILRDNQHLFPMPKPRSVITVADEMRDMREATDAIITNISEVCCAMRVRRNNVLASYRNEFTIRIKSRGGGPSELDKIKAGHCSVYFYGFANASDDGLEFWRIIDVDKFRLWLLKMEEMGHKQPYQIINNQDGTMGAGFRLRNQLTECVICDSSTKDAGQLTLF